MTVNIFFVKNVLMTKIIIAITHLPGYKDIGVGIKKAKKKGHNMRTLDIGCTDGGFVNAIHEVYGSSWNDDQRPNIQQATQE